MDTTKVTDKEESEYWQDEYGVKYSVDHKRLLGSEKGLTTYVIPKGTEVICDFAFYCVFGNKITAV